MSRLVRHSHHLVQESPWPVLSCLGGLYVTSGILMWFHTNDVTLFLLGFLILLLIRGQWWRDVAVEGAILGLHTADVEKGLRAGILLFIASEVLFFVRFF